MTQVCFGMTSLLNENIDKIQLPFKHSFLIFSIKRPLLVDFVPHMPAQVVAIVLEGADLGQYLIHYSPFLILKSFCKYTYILKNVHKINIKISII